jgi:hypothetical protein
MVVGPAGAGTGSVRRSGEPIAGVPLTLVTIDAVASSPSGQQLDLTFDLFTDLDGDHLPHFSK